MDRYYDIASATGGTARKSRSRCESATPRQAGGTGRRWLAQRGRVPRLDSESGVVGADQKAA
jgi:hypothetical protein